MSNALHDIAWARCFRKDQTFVARPKAEPYIFLIDSYNWMKEVFSEQIAQRTRDLGNWGFELGNKIINFRNRIQIGALAWFIQGFIRLLLKSNYIQLLS